MYAKDTGNGVALARTQINDSWVEVTNTLPDRIYRDAWELSGTEIVINATKQAKIDAKIQRQTDGDTIKADTQVKQLINASPTAIDNFIDTNVTDLASAKQVLKRLAKAVSAIGREAFTDD